MRKIFYVLAGSLLLFSCDLYEKIDTEIVELPNSKDSIIVPDWDNEKDGNNDVGK